MEKKLRELREKRGLSQSAVAEFIGVSRQMYSKYESGEVDPSLKAIRLLCKLYDVSGDYLLDVGSGKTKYSFESDELSVSSVSPVYGSTNYLSQIIGLVPRLLYSEKARLLNYVAQSMSNDVEAGKMAQQSLGLGSSLVEPLPEEYEKAFESVREYANQIGFNSNGMKWTRDELHER